MNRKPLLLDLLKQARGLEGDFVAGLSAEERDRIGSLEEWSAKDVISHITARKALMADGVITAIEGRTPIGSDDLDRENAILYDEYHDKSWDNVNRIAQDTLGRIVARVESLGEEDLARSARFFPWQEERPLWRRILGSGYIHPIGHLAEVHRDRGDRRSAGEMLGEMARSMVDLDEGPAWQGEVRYTLACSHALLEDKEEAIRLLRESLALNSRLIEWAKDDPDLEAIQDEPECQALFAE